MNDKHRACPQQLPGYRGKIDELDVVAASCASEVKPVGASAPPPDISLTDMAARAMHYLIHNPLPDHDHVCRFDIELLRCPPSMWPGTRDPYITFGDTESRMDWEFIYMREMSGSKEGLDVEQAIRRRILGYIREDGLSWLPPYCLTCNLSDHEPCAMTWTTGATLMSLVEQYVRTGDRENIPLAKRLVAGLKSLASWDTGRACYPGGLGGWRGGDWMYTGCSDSYPCILEPLARYVEVTGDEEALEFAQAFADGNIADLQANLGPNRILKDGSFAGYNCHLHMRAVLGVVHLGVLTRNTRYIEWGRRAYDFLISQGADWGWFPESIGTANSETCATGDMADIAAWLARAGYSRYWDDLERFVRNYIREAQFFVTPAYEALYRKVNVDHQPEQVEEGLRQARDFEGGFVARLSPNSLVTGANSMSMMGCCPPEGMRTLHSAWRNVVTESPEGVFVNLSFNHDAPQASVVSFAPGVGRLTVVARKSADFFLRPPSWAPRTEVKAYRGGRQAPVVWQGDYIKFEHATGSEELTIVFPVLRFRQTVEVAGQTYTYDWVGNTVTRVKPRAEVLPLFDGRRPV